MNSRQLSPEIVSLIHHVELNKSGWWKKAVGQVVRGVLWMSQSPLTVEQLQRALQREIGIRLPDDTLNKQLETLSEQGAVSTLPGPSYKLTEHAYRELSKARDEALAEQEDCHTAFLASCTRYCADLDAANVWQQFTKALVNAIQVAGANLFHLLVDGNLQKDVDWLADLIKKFDIKSHEGLRKVLTEFFAPRNRACRNQVLRFLTAHFFAESAQLRPETLNAIENGRKTRIIRVVLDTNFIFSILQLHDNPADESALSLIDLAQKSHGKLDIKLYVLPSTLDEAKRVLLSQLRLVEHVRTTTTMARVALTQPLPSIAKKFFSAASKAPGLKASEFFQPYIDDLKTILRERGIAVLDAHPAIYHQRQDVVNDVLDEVKREASLPQKRQKGYDTLLHDAVLWHAVTDRRTMSADSPFEVEYWAVSIDWRLIAFDRAKRAANQLKLPVVLHPSNLVQLIQFWVPRTPELEESLVDALRLPLFFQSFDPEDERATLKVLETISRFKNVEDLPEPTLKIVLANQALRTRLRDAEASNDEALELVREELLSYHKDVLAQLETTQGDLKQHEELLGIERQERTQANSERDAATRRLQEMEDKARNAEQKAQTLEAERIRLEAERAREVKEAHADVQSERSRADAAERRLARLQYSFLFLFFPVTAGFLLSYYMPDHMAEILPMLNQGWKAWMLKATFFLLPVCIAFALSPWYARDTPHLTSWWPVRLTNFVGKKLIIAPVVAGISAIYQGGVWDGLKTLLGITS